MAKAKNMVVSGKNQGKPVKVTGGTIYFGTDPLFKSDVQSFQLITANQTKSGTSAVLRGAAGAALLGPVGMLAGLSAKNNLVYTVVIVYNDLTKSVIEVDDKIYAQLMQNLI